MQNDSPQKTMPKLLSIPEACEILGISHWTLRHWLSRGLLPSYKLGKRRLIHPEDIKNLIQRSRQEATAPKELRL